MGEGIAIAEISSVLRARQVKLPSEIGAFVALQTCEALAERPLAPSVRDVRILEDGNVAVATSAPRASSEAAAAAVHLVFRELMQLAGGGLPPMLFAIADGDPPDGDAALARLHDELEASLIPLNRSASRRVLARLVREAQRVIPGAGGQPIDDAIEIDLEAWLGDTAAPTTSTGAVAAASSTSSPGTVAAVSRASSPGTVAAVSSPGTVPAIVATSDSDTSSSPASLRPPRAPSLDGERRAPRDRAGLLTALAIVALLATVLGAVATLRPDLVARVRRAAKPPSERTAPTPPTATAAPAPMRPRGRLVVRSSTPGAQILLFVGRGPAFARGLPIGVAHEFVALADGKAPARSVVPANATFTDINGRPVYELAIMAGPPPDGSLVDLGSTELTADSLGAPSGRLGDVRVVTNPPGAKVFLTIGFAPEARVDNLPLDEAHEVIVFARGHALERVVIGPSDFRDAPDGRIAEIDVALGTSGR